MRKKSTGMPAVALISGTQIDQPKPLKAGGSGTVLFLHETELERLRWQLSVPNLDDRIRRFIQSEIDRLTLSGVAAREQSHAASKLKRKGKPERRAMIDAMAHAKCDGQTLKEFLQTAKAGGICGLVVGGENCFIFERPGEDEMKYTAGSSALEKCWTEASAKKAPKTKIGS